MKNNFSALGGFNLYKSIYGDTVYYNTFDKNGYIVSKQVEPQFRIFYNRYSIIIVFLILLADYFNSFQTTLFVGAISVILSELYFRLIYLKKLKCINNFNRTKKISKLDSIIQSNEKEKSIMKSCAYIVLSVLIVINAIQQNYNLIFVLLSIVVSVYSLYAAGINIIAFNKIKNKK